MSFRAKIIFFSLAALALLLAIFLVLRGRGRKPPESAAPSPVPVSAPAAPLPAPATAAPGVTVTTRAALDAFRSSESIKVVARNFTERFGSYSVLANFSNFDELKTAVTTSTWEWLKTYRLELPKKTGPEFIGVTTRVLSMKIISQNESQASVMVSTQREETLTSGNRVTYRDLRVELILKDKQWLVDGAYWQ